MSDEADPSDDQPVKKRVRVPVGRRDIFGEFNDSIEVDEDVADQWSARVWHERPPR